MRTFITAAIAALLVLLPVVGAQAQEGGKTSKAAGTKYETAKGFYVQGGLFVAKTSGSLGGPNVGAGGGGGWRFLPWLGADVDGYWSGRNQGPSGTRNGGFAVNGKFYPLGLFSPKTLDAFQPYAVLGIGMGTGSDDEYNGGWGALIIRVGAGLDWLLTDHVALYTDVSLHEDVWPSDRREVYPPGRATGVYQLGVKFTF